MVIALIALALIVLVVMGVVFKVPIPIYRLSVLNVVSSVVLFGAVVYTIINWAVLSADEGWGVVAMLLIAGVAIVSLIVDFVAQQIIKNRKALLILEGLVVIIILILSLWPGGR